MSKDGIGRPEGTGKYGSQRCRSYRLSLCAHAWIRLMGSRDYLESIVPEYFRNEYEEKSGKKFKVTSKTEPLLLEETIQLVEQGE